MLLSSSSWRPRPRNACGSSSCGALARGMRVHPTLARRGPPWPRPRVLRRQVCGTPEYFAPELAEIAQRNATKRSAEDEGDEGLGGEDEGYGPPLDCWAVGCIVYELLAGGPPFTANDENVRTPSALLPPPMFHLALYVHVALRTLSSCCFTHAQLTAPPACCSLPPSTLPRTLPVPLPHLRPPPVPSPALAPVGSHHRTDSYALLSPYLSYTHILSLSLSLSLSITHSLALALARSQVLFYRIIDNAPDLVHAPFDSISPPAIDLIKQLLTSDPAERLSCVDALSHPWLQEGQQQSAPLPPTVHVNRRKSLGAREDTAAAAAAAAAAAVPEVDSDEDTTEIANAEVMRPSVADGASPDAQ